MTQPLPFSPAADRNKTPILDALGRLLPECLDVLEIASGSGQHAQHFAAAHPGWRWQPSEADAGLLQAIDARCRGLGNVLPAIRLDVLQGLWPEPPAGLGAVYGANLLHIAPWAACVALMQGAAACLAGSGYLLLYGPYRVEGVATAPGNEAFDADLRARNPAWGLRTLAAVEGEARAAGLGLEQMLAMPANNLLLVFRKT